MDICKVKKNFGVCVLCDLNLPHFDDFIIKGNKKTSKITPDFKEFMEELKKSLTDKIKVEKRFIPIYQYFLGLFYSYNSLEFFDEIKFQDKRQIVELFSKVATDSEINDLGCDCLFSRHLVNLASSYDERMAKDSALASEVFFEIQEELINIFWSAQKVIFEEIFDIARQDYNEFKTMEEI